MAEVVLVHPLALCQVSDQSLLQKCDLFTHDPKLKDSPYTLKSQVSLADFRAFVSALEGTPITITNKNLTGLSRLCDEFHFRDLAAQLLHFRDSDNFNEKETIEDVEAGIPIPITEITHCGALFEDAFTFTATGITFECTVGQAVAVSPMVREQLSTDACASTFTLRDERAVQSVRGLLSGGAASTPRSLYGLGQQLGIPGLDLEWTGTDRVDLDSVEFAVLSVEALDEILEGALFSIASEDDLLKRLLSVGDEYSSLLRWIEVQFLSAAGVAALAEHFLFPPEGLCCSILGRVLPPPPPSPRGWNSVIVPDFPELFDDFKEKQFTLLWRASRDGFSSRGFHSRCDGHPDTLTVILDTDGNIFGGFTPVKWDSTSCHKPDSTMKSFIFTLKNPSNTPPRKFVLRNYGTKNEAIYCLSRQGPSFNDFGVYDQSDSNADSYSSCLGCTYANDTQLDPHTFLTGSGNFRTKEIEVFEIST
jgi:hypothetical protein